MIKNTQLVVKTINVSFELSGSIRIRYTHKGILI